MKTSTFIIFTCFITALSGCSKDVRKTEIPGLDLSKHQDRRYFSANLDAAKKFLEWCDKEMVEPIPKDKISQMFAENCSEAWWGVALGKKRERPRSSYQSF